MKDELKWDGQRRGSTCQARRISFAISVLGGGKASRRAELAERLRSATLHIADETLLASAAKRALRWGGNIYLPMLGGSRPRPWSWSVPWPAP
jgi:hypothetical protein